MGIETEGNTDNSMIMEGDFVLVELTVKKSVRRNVVEIRF